jgi:GGDEF domain-containing protein
MAVGCGVLVVLYPVRPVHHPIVSAYVVAMLYLAIRALRMGPARQMAAGQVTLAMMSLFMGFFALLTVLGMVTQPWGSLGSDLYHAVYVLGVPAALTGIGLFALFLLAEDLAHDMRNLAIVDPLTGLLNRRGFDEAARRVKAQCRRGGIPVCVAVADLDHFKSINDRLGHKAGDLVLSEFARRLRAGLREGDLVSRAGGEEAAAAGGRWPGGG